MISSVTDIILQRIMSGASYLRDYGPALSSIPGYKT